MDVLRRAAARKSEWPLLTKSGLMVGLGETIDELLQTFRDIKETDCEILTVGQYLAPTPRHLPIERYYTPDEFSFMKSEAEGMGFRYVEAGPLVRSSYHAGRHTEQPTEASIPTETSVLGGRETRLTSELVQLKRA
jgi:lipoic acid synthetase